MPDVELGHGIMHIIGLRKADRLPLQPFQVRAEVQIIPLYSLGPCLADPVPRRRQVLLVGLQRIGAVTHHLAIAQLRKQPPATRVAPTPQMPTDDLLAGSIEAIPEPARVRLLADK